MIEWLIGWYQYAYALVRRPDPPPVPARRASTPSLEETPQVVRNAESEAARTLRVEVESNLKDQETLRRSRDETPPDQRPVDKDGVGGLKLLGDAKARQATKDHETERKIDHQADVVSNGGGPALEAERRRLAEILGTAKVLRGYYASIKASTELAKLLDGADKLDVRMDSLKGKATADAVKSIGTMVDEVDQDAKAAYTAYKNAIMNQAVEIETKTKSLRTNLREKLMGAKKTLNGDYTAEIQLKNLGKEETRIVERIGTWECCLAPAGEIDDIAAGLGGLVAQLDALIPDEPVAVAIPLDRVDSYYGAEGREREISVGGMTKLKIRIRIDQSCYDSMDATNKGQIKTILGGDPVAFQTSSGLGGRTIKWESYGWTFATKSDMRLHTSNKSLPKGAYPSAGTLFFFDTINSKAH